MSDPFSPVQLGPVTLRNRVIKAATSEGRSPEGASAPGQIVMSPQALTGLRRLTEAVHGAGAAISAQLGHAGVVAPKALTGVTAVAPSRFVNPMSSISSALRRRWPSMPDSTQSNCTSGTCTCRAPS